MADVEPLHALHYDLSQVGGLQPVAAPPYDVIDAAQRAELLGRSPYNVVEIDLPQNGGDPYAHAAEVLKQLDRRRDRRARRRRPRCGRSRRTTPGPDGQPRTRHGVFARVRVEDYGPGRIRPHERTHPGPKEDRLRLTRATRANLSPIFSLYDDPAGAAWGARRAVHRQRAVGRGDRRRRHRPPALADRRRRRRSTPFKHALDGVELLIADGHHRYETARVYAQEPTRARRRPRADVPGRAAGPRPDRLPHAPARDRPRRRHKAALDEAHRARLGRRADRRRSSQRRRTTSGSATTTARPAAT